MNVIKENNKSPFLKSASLMFGSLIYDNHHTKSSIPIAFLASVMQQTEIVE